MKSKEKSMAGCTDFCSRDSSVCHSSILGSQMHKWLPVLDECVKTVLVISGLLTPSGISSDDVSDSCSEGLGSGLVKNGKIQSVVWD